MDTAPERINETGAAAASGTPPPEADRQRAATLIGAGYRAGGEARVWAPGAWELRSGIVLGIAGVLTIVCLVCFSALGGTIPLLAHYYHHWQILTGEVLGFGVLPAVILIAAVYAASRRFEYLRTDSQGIELAGRKTRHTLPWHEITAASLFGSFLTLTTDDSRVTTYLAGYTRGIRRELLATIAHRADLYSSSPYRCVRAERMGNRTCWKPELPLSPCVRTERASFYGFVASVLASVFLLTLSIAAGRAILHIDREYRAGIWWPSVDRAHTVAPVLRGLIRNIGQLDEPSFEGPSAWARRHIVDIRVFVAQRPGDPLAVVTSPASEISMKTICWAPAIFESAHPRVYEYVLVLLRLNASAPPPRQIRVRLDYGSRARWITVVRSSNWRMSEGRDGIPVYSNNWDDAPAKEVESGHVVGALPPLRRW
ncbi:MAG: hypothetical protein LC772_01660, partial [Chloroflexi bacterium]|nr:hypothetical protein [Chloroflexota bacterium]